MSDSPATHDAIASAISDHGPITFAEFMELALYGPGGFYTSGFPVSATGDYFTAPSAHPVFGAKIALQLREMWQQLGSPDTFDVIEVAAGNGSLAADITEYVPEIDAQFAEALRYTAIDIAPPLRSEHYPVLTPDATPTNVIGCTLSNELIDAMPVHRFAIERGHIREITVGLENGNFVEVLAEPSSIIDQTVGPILSSLPEGFRGEVNPGIRGWAKRQSRILKTGWALIFDYGFDRKDLYSPGRSAGTLRTYYQHTLGQDPLKDVGRRDITSHVDFTAIDEHMRDVGFVSAGRTTQAEFLTRLGIAADLEQLQANRLTRTEQRANEVGINALIAPGGMGDFVVTAFAKGVENLPLAGFSGEHRAQAVKPGIVPTLNPRRHINLAGQQQPGYFEVDSFESLFSDDA